MPVYVYKCPECEAKFEQTLPIKLHVKTYPCPKCPVQAEQVITGGVGCTGFAEGEGWEDEAPY